MIDLHQNAETALRMVRESKDLAYDTETSGLDWKRNVPIGYVFTTDPKNSIYVPIRHGGGGNLQDTTGKVKPLEAAVPELWHVHPFELELAKAFADRTRTIGNNGRVIGHNMQFDCHSSMTAGIYLGRNITCTQNTQTLINEYTKGYTLEALGNLYGVTAKKADEMYKHLGSLFNVPGVKGAMEHYWRTSGTDPVAYDYAVGDGVTTLEVAQKQLLEIEKQDLGFIHEVENNLIWTLVRMERRGIPVDVEYIDRLLTYIEGELAEARAALPPDFNPRSPLQMKALMEANGHTDWPLTPPTTRFPNGNPSFTAKWLKGHETGRKVVALREWTNLVNSFIMPLRDTHAFQGADGVYRVHASLKQNASDEGGTVAGRLACGAPNLQAVPKHNKPLAAKLRRAFIAEEGMDFCEADLSQCFVAGTEVSVPATLEHPNGVVNIEDVKPGQLVYAYDDALNLVLKPVTWAGKTGVRKVVRVKWMTNGRTFGEFLCTSDHRIRLRDGTYKTVDELRALPNTRRGNNPYFHRVLALSREKLSPRGAERWYLRPTGTKGRYIESRFVGLSVHGEHEHFHHIDGNTLNNDPANLEGVKAKDHAIRHGFNDKPAILKLIAEGLSNVEIANTLGVPRQTVNGYRVRNNHIIYDFEDVEGEFPVYDITVDEVHNFIANQVCVHNCEPRLFAHYSKDKNLVEGYNAVPPKDVHTIVAEFMGVDRGTTGKRMNMGIFTGMQIPTFAEHMGLPRSEAAVLFNKWYELFPGVRKFQTTAKNVQLDRGYVKTILGRRGRLEASRFAYKATSRIIQGGNADIIKHKLTIIDMELEKLEEAWLTMSIHDSILWMTPKGERGAEINRWIVAQMIDVQVPPYNLIVPFAADFECGDNWAEASFGHDNSVKYGIEA